MNTAVKNPPKPQTVASQKYQKKIGMISKSYKLKADLVDAFSKACAAAGVSQSAQLTYMMSEFVEQAKKRGL